MIETERTLGMKKNTLPKIIALIFAIMAHLLILHLWLADDEVAVSLPSNTASQSNFEISLLPQTDAPAENTAPSIQQDTESTKGEVDTSTPANTPLIGTENEALPLSDIKDFVAFPQEPEDNGETFYTDESDNLTTDASESALETDDLNESKNEVDETNLADTDQTSETSDTQPKAGHEVVDTEAEFTDLRKIEKPSLLNVEIDEHENATNSATEKVFSPTLKEQITSSQKTQKEYLKAQTKETRYPITEDADGTRYVNIKGVCWRIPKDNQKEEWTVVLSGCGGQTKTFLFELNIAPDILGTDSPFNLPQ
ncbi:hypothetical protein ACUM5Y_15540 [Marinomonas dokdonensis]|uniref:hypothetical protein n=1 Tax=Marinomonas dokdonensis TaxID=328224 RepID=UPI0040559BBD